jgi:hypothetical protein
MKRGVKMKDEKANVPEEVEATTVPEMNLEGGEIEMTGGDYQPTYELTAEELVFPVTLMEENEEYMILCHMRPYRAYDCKELLADIGLKLKLGQESIIQSDSSSTYKFFFDHFRGLSEIEFDGKEPTFEQAKEFVKDNPRHRFEEQVVLRGFGGVGVEIAPVTATKKFQIVKSQSRQVKTFFHMYNLERKELEKILITHTLRRETEFDFRRYNQATARSKVTRKNEWMKVEDYSTIEQIYDTMILAVDGFRYKGEPTTESNKDKWVKLVPFWHKHFILSEHFKGVQVKNVE